MSLDFNGKSFAIELSVYGVIPSPWLDKGVTMAKQKKKKVSNVISVRVSDHEMESIREMMRITKLNASAVMREAFKSIISPAA